MRPGFPWCSLCFQHNHLMTHVVVSYISRHYLHCGIRDPQPTAPLRPSLSCRSATVFSASSQLPFSLQYNVFPYLPTSYPSLLTRKSRSRQRVLQVVWSDVDSDFLTSTFCLRVR